MARRDVPMPKTLLPAQPGKRQGLLQLKGDLERTRRQGMTTVVEGEWGMDRGSRDSATMCRISIMSHITGRSSSRIGEGDGAGDEK